jgi:hypothetical protein
MAPIESSGSPPSETESFMICYHSATVADQTHSGEKPPIRFGLD